MELEQGVTIVPKYTSGDVKLQMTLLSEENISESRINTSPVELQELQCIAADTKTIATYNYGGISVVEMHGQVMHPKPHHHDYFELILPQTKDFEMQIESMLVQFGRWDVCVLNRTTKHTEHFKQGDMVSYLHLSADYLRGEPAVEKVSLRSFDQLSEFFYRDLGDQNRHFKDYIHLRYVGSDMVSPLYRVITQMRVELERKEPGYQLLEYALVFRMFCILSDPMVYRAEYINLGSDDGASLALSAKQILDGLNRKLTKNEISERLNYDAEYINRIFKRHYGNSIPEYNRRRCMQLAADMLQGTRLPVSEICRRVGYTNRTHFYRMFVEQYGCTPIEYRAKQFPGVKN